LGKRELNIYNIFGW